MSGSIRRTYKADVPPRFRGAHPQHQIFARHVRMLLLARVKWAAGLAALLLPMGVFVDYRELGESGARILPLRLLVSALFVVIYIATRIRPLAKRVGALSFLLTVTGAAGATFLSREAGTAMTLYYGSCHLVVLSCALLFPWSPTQMALAAMGVTAVFTTPQLFADGNLPQGFVTETYLLICSSVIATIGAFLSHKLRFREFRSRRALQIRTRELRQTSQQLQKMDRARTEFYANVSHELRTPLTLILAPVEQLRAMGTLVLPEPVSKHLDTIHRNGLLLLRLINGILDLHRLEAKQELQRVPVELAALLSRLMEEFQTLAERRSIQLDLQNDGCPPLLADPERIETIFRNLLANAIKFSAEGGRVQVTISAVEGSVCADVSDAGKGIAPQDLQRIFQRYERVEGTEVPGSGLGLSMVKELVEWHGGSVSVHKTSPEGSVFRVLLPAAMEVSPVTPDPVSLRTLERPRPGLVEGEGEIRERVLVVEDNDELLDFLVEFLSPHFHVLEARTTHAALEKVRQEQPSVIVSDVMLPGDSGMSLIRALHQDPATASIPVIFLTALHGLEAKVEGLEQGAADYVSKPFVPSELLARIRVQLRLRQLSSDLAQSQKLSMLHTLSAGLAHEIRNPINAITNAVALLRRTVRAADDATAVVPELMVVIEESCDRMAALIDDLLSFTDGRSRGTGLWNPMQAVESALRLLHPRLADVHVHQELLFRGEVEGNAVRLNQVVLNLLDNALRAVSPRGDVWVRTEMLGNSFSFTVRDSGQGIRAEELSRVFDPFYSTRAVNEGLGLGLHICRTIVEAHGGQISVASEWGKGASFTIRLPAEARSSQAA